MREYVPRAEQRLRESRKIARGKLQRQSDISDWFYVGQKETAQEFSYRAKALDMVFNVWSVGHGKYRVAGEYRVQTIEFETSNGTNHRTSLVRYLRDKLGENGKLTDLFK
jgi:hypothetical protein